MAAEKENGVKKVRSETLDELDDISLDGDMKLVEAILFVSGKFLSMQELVSYSDLNPIILREILKKLQEKFNNGKSAINIVEKNGMWKMDVVQEYASLVGRLAGGSSEFSKAEQETLAIIAYKQPIKQSVVIKIRGNKGYDHIKRFSELGFLRKKKQGHTYELSLSEEFYDYFNVSHGQERSFTANGDNSSGEE